MVNHDLNEDDEGVWQHRHWRSQIVFLGVTKGVFLVLEKFRSTFVLRYDIRVRLYIN